MDVIGGANRTSLGDPGGGDASANATDADYADLCAGGGEPNRTSVAAATEPTVLSDIPPKEVIIVVAMLALWVYSIVLTRKAWYRILKQ